MLVIFVIAIALLFFKDSVVTKRFEEPVNVSVLLNEVPLSISITVEGNVSEVLSNYVSKKGLIYNRYLLSDGFNDVLVFCPELPINITTGLKLLITARLEEFGSMTELTYCQNVRIVK